MEEEQDGDLQGAPTGISTTGEESMQGPSFTASITRARAWMLAEAGQA